MADVGAQAGKEGFRVLDPLLGTEARFRLGVVMSGQALDLLDVEHGVALHEVDFTVDLLAGRTIGFLARDGIGINNEEPFSPLRTCAFSSGLV